MLNDMTMKELVAMRNTLNEELETAVHNLVMLRVKIEVVREELANRIKEK